MKTTRARRVIGATGGSGVTLDCTATRSTMLVRPAGLPTTRAGAGTMLRRLGPGIAGEFGELARAAATPRGTSPARWHRL